MTRRRSEWASPVGRALTEALAERGETKKWLAEQIDVDSSSVTRILAGERAPTLDQLSNMAKALGVTRRSLLARAGYLDGTSSSTIDVDRLGPVAARMVRSIVRDIEADANGGPDRE